MSCPNVDICAADPPTTARLLAGKIHLVDASSAVTAVLPDPRGTPVAGPVTATRYMQAFLPAQPLAPDTLYALDLTSDADAVVGVGAQVARGAEGTTVNPQAAPVTEPITVFSGSRPLPVEIRAVDVSTKPLTYLRVRFSEPVVAGSVVGGVVFLDPRGATLPSCPWSPATNACTEAGAPQLSDIVDFVFPKPLAMSDLVGGRLAVSGAIHGDGRTLGEAATMVRRTVDAARDTMTVPLDATAWFSCGANGDDVCFRDPTAR